MGTRERSPTVAPVVWSWTPDGILHGLPMTGTTAGPCRVMPGAGRIDSAQVDTRERSSAIGAPVAWSWTPAGILHGLPMTGIPAGPRRVMPGAGWIDGAMVDTRERSSAMPIQNFPPAAYRGLMLEYQLQTHEFFRNTAPINYSK